jgi:hypothetical protein
MVHKHKGQERPLVSLNHSLPYSERLLKDDRQISPILAPAQLGQLPRHSVSPSKFIYAPYLCCGYEIIMANMTVKRVRTIYRIRKQLTPEQAAKLGRMKKNQIQ